MSPSLHRFDAQILIVSDRCSRGESDDRSGPAAQQFLQNLGMRTGEPVIVPDEVALISQQVTTWVREGAALIVCSGGTGLGPRDVTPEAIEPLLQRRLSALETALASGSLQQTPMAMLSRYLAGSIDKTLILALPGSPKAVVQCLEIVRPVLEHGLELLAGDNPH